MSRTTKSILFFQRNLRVTVQTGSKLEAFFAAFSRKTRVQRRAAHAKRIGIAARKRYMSTPFEGAWTVTGDDHGGDNPHPGLFHEQKLNQRNP